jgi:hypothetical protein
MKNPCVLVALAVACALPAAAAVQNPPDTTIPRIKLDGDVKIDTRQLKLISKSAAACTSPEFTVEEFVRVAPPRSIKEEVVVRNGNREVVRTVMLPARNDKPARAVSLPQYVAEVNAVEQFYNLHGMTLRRGQLAAPQRATGARAAATGCISRDSLRGVQAALPLIHYSLVDAADGPRHGGPLDVHVQTIPNRRGPGDVMAGINPGDALMRPGQLNFKGKLASVGKNMPKNKPQGVAPSPPPAACPKACSLKLGESAFLTPAAQLLLSNPNDIVETIYGCNITTMEANNAATCPPLQKFVKRTITRREQWEGEIDTDFFFAHYNDPCAVIAHQKQVSMYSNADSLYKYSAESAGTEEVTTGEAAKSFFDGILHYKNTGIADCVIDVGNNSMFGVQFCLTYNSANNYKQASGYNIHNDAGVVTDVTLFGMDYNLVGGEARIDWKQPVAVASSLPLVQPQVASSLKQSHETQHFQGPSATFPVGPIPLTVRTFADADMSIGQPVSTFTAPPLVNGSQATGKIGMNVSAGTNVSVGMDAAIDALILSAGISAKLSLVDNAVNGGITSLITPGKNELTVEKAYQFQATTLKGSISAFVEIDLLIYTERYSVDIVNFPGKTKTYPLQTSKWGPVKAVIPGSEHTAPVCK